MSIRLQAHGGGRLQCIVVHIDPSLTRPRINQVIRTLHREVIVMAPHSTLIGGDWNFMEQRGVLHTDAGDRHNMSMVSPVFYQVLPHVVEHFQPLYIRSYDRTPRGREILAH